MPEGVGRAARLHCRARQKGPRKSFLLRQGFGTCPRYGLIGWEANMAFTVWAAIKLRAFQAQAPLTTQNRIYCGDTVVRNIG